MELTGVSARNIRFYEDKGLLAPNRNKENDYREYTPEDIARLKMIRALRMVDIPLEQIKRVADGEISLQEAVASQKKELKQKIRKIKTAIDFCDELEKVEGQNVEEVLVRMDQPENRKELFDKWKTDFAEAARKIMATFCFLFPVLIAGIYMLPYFADLFHLPDGYILLISFVLIALWGYLGYRLYDVRWWWFHGLLANIPLLILAILQIAMAATGIYLIWPAIIIGFMSMAMYFPYFMLNLIFTSNEMVGMDYMYAFLIAAVVFGIGMLLGWMAHRRKEKGKMAFPRVRDFFDKHKRSKTAAWILLIAVLLTLPAFVDCVAYVHPDTIAIEARNTGYSSTKVEFDGKSHWVYFEEEFAELLVTEEWERQYVHFGFGEEVLRVGAMRFYSNNVVRLTLSNEGPYGTDRYVVCKVPQGTAEKLLEYIEENLEDIEIDVSC